MGQMVGFRETLRGLARNQVVHRQFRRITLMEGRSCQAGEDRVVSSDREHHTWRTHGTNKYTRHVFLNLDQRIFLGGIGQR